MKIFTALKWLFTKAPYSITQEDKTSKPCLYCGSKKYIYNWMGISIICVNCQKKVYDTVLKKKKNG